MAAQARRWIGPTTSPPLSASDLAAGAALIRRRDPELSICGELGGSLAGIEVRKHGLQALAAALDAWDEQWARDRWCWHIQNYLLSLQKLCEGDMRERCQRELPRQRLEKPVPAGAVGSMAQDLIHVVWEPNEPHFPPRAKPPIESATRSIRRRARPALGTPRQTLAPTSWRTAT